MNLRNQDIAAILQKIADILEINGENPYRVRAYRRAARRVENYPKPIPEMIANDYDLLEIPAVGSNIASRIKEIVRTGALPEVFHRRKISKHFFNELKRIEGLGQRRIHILNNEFKIYSKKELLTAIAEGRLRGLRGFTEKLEQKIIESIKHPKPYERLFKFRVARLIVSFVEEFLTKLDSVKSVITTSAIRRKVDLVGNVVMLVTSTQPKTVIEEFLELNLIDEIVSQKTNEVIVILRAGLHITLRVVPEVSLPTATLIHTGNVEHVAELKKIATQKKLILEEKGLFQNKKRIGVKNEKEIYKYLGLDYIDPVLRENRGEILAAKKHALPQLIQLIDIKGDLHSHTNETDGIEPLEVMVQAAIHRGYKYLAITDHTQRLKITNGLDEKRLRQQIELIDRLNEKLQKTGFTILKSSEVDIMADGSLDLPNSVLKELDIRVCSVHSLFRLPLEKQTERIIRAMDNPYFNILGHMTGRLLQHRQPYQIDVEKIFLAAKERNCAIEINAQPSRLDIHDEYAKMAKEIGLKFTISSDAHSIRELDFMEFGVYQAQRGWLEVKDVLNTYEVDELKALIKRKN